MLAKEMPGRSSREFSVLIQVGEHAELSLPLTLVFTDAYGGTGPPPARPPSGTSGPRPPATDIGHRTRGPYNVRPSKVKTMVRSDHSDAAPRAP